jgi:hypothetical protein
MPISKIASSPETCDDRLRSSCQLSSLEDSQACAAGHRGGDAGALRGSNARAAISLTGVAFAELVVESWRDFRQVIRNADSNYGA